MRYYQPTKSDFLDDAMYQHPVELMAAAIQANDKRYNDFQDTQDEYSELLNLLPHQKDSEEARKLIQKDREFLESLTKEADKGGVPLSVVNRKAKAFGRELKRKVASGDYYHLNKAQKEKDRIYQETLKKYREKPQLFPYIQDESEISRRIDDRYPGYKNEDGTYNPFPEYSLAGRDEDLKIVGDVFAQKLGKDYLETKDYATFLKTIGKEGWSPKEIEETISAYISSDDGIQKSYQEELEYRKLRGEEDLTLEEVKTENVQKLVSLATNLKQEQVVRDELRMKPSTKDTDPNNPTTYNPSLSRTVNITYKNPFVEKGFRDPHQVMNYQESELKKTEEQINKYAEDLKASGGFEYINGQFYNAEKNPVSINVALASKYGQSSLPAQVSTLAGLIERERVLSMFAHNYTTGAKAIKDSLIDKDISFNTNPFNTIDKKTYTAVDNAVKKANPNQVKFLISDLQKELLAKGYKFKYVKESDEEFKERYKGAEKGSYITLEQPLPKEEWIKGELLFAAMPPMLSKQTETSTKGVKEGEGDQNIFGMVNPDGESVGKATISGTPGSFAKDTNTEIKEKGKPEFTGTTMFATDPSDFDSPVASQVVTIGNQQFNVIMDLSDVAVDENTMAHFKGVKAQMQRLKQMYDLYPQGLMNPDPQDPYIKFNLVGGEAHIPGMDSKIQIVEEANGKNYLYQDNLKVSDIGTMHKLLDMIIKVSK